MYQMQNNKNECIYSDSENPSICIPRVFNTINVSSISNIFQNKLNLGKIKKIDMIKTSDPKFKKVFIHFHLWNDNDNTQSIKKKIFEGTVVKIVYDYPWFWKCSLSKSISN